MTTLTSDNSSSTFASTSLSIQIVQPGAEERSVTLPLGKCTVGSSERCQVHLTCGQVRPLHCLIVQEPTGTTVTRWAPGALLNGQDFAAAPFRPGDCLQIGDVHLTLIAAADVSTEPQAKPEQTPASAVGSVFTPPTSNTTQLAFVPTSIPVETPGNNTEQPELNSIADFPATSTPIETVANSEEANRLVSRLEKANENARQRCRNLVGSLRTMRDKVTSFDQRINELEQQLAAALGEREQIFSQLSELQTETGERESQSSAEIDRLISELTTAYEKAGVAEAALAEHEQQVEQFQGELQRQLTEALAEKERLTIQLSQVQAEAGERESQSTQEIDRLIAELAAAYEKATAAEASLTEHVQQAEESQTELASLRGQRDQWEQVRSAGEMQRTKLAQALADREQAIEIMQSELEQAREAADQADESRIEQAAQLADLLAELEQAVAERDQLSEAQAQSLQYQLEIEQSLADSDQNLAVFQLELEKFQLTSRQTDQELSETSEAFESLRAEVATLTEERDLLVTRRTEYQLREQGWEHELSSRDEKIDKLSREIEQLNASIDEANQGAAKQGSQVESFQQQLDSLTAERDQLLTAQADQVQKNQEWEEAIASRDRRIKELEEEHDGICQVLQSVEQGAFEQVDFANKLQGQLDGLRAERDQLADAIPEQQEYSKQLEQALAERDGQITLLSEELTKTTERQSKLELQLASGTSASQALEAEVTELRARNQQLVAEQTSSEQSKTLIELKLAESEQRIEALRQQLDSAEQQRRELEQTVATGSQSTEAFQAEFNELHARYEKITAEYQAETDRRQELDQQLAEGQQNIELFKVDLKSVQLELERSIEQVSTLQTERDTLNRQLTGLREELAAEEKIGSTVDSELQQERDELASELAAVRFQLVELQQQDGVVAEETTSAQAIIEQLEEEKSSLQLRANQQEQQAKQLTAELQDLRSQSTASQTEFEQVEQLYQQSQNELEQARECLQLAEQALQNCDVLPVSTEVQESKGFDEAQTEPEIESSNYATEPEGSSESTQETADFHDVYATEQDHEVDDAYRNEMDPTTAGATNENDKAANVAWGIPDETTEEVSSSEPSAEQIGEQDALVIEEAYEAREACESEASSFLSEEPAETNSVPDKATPADQVTDSYEEGREDNEAFQVTDTVDDTVDEPIVSNSTAFDCQETEPEQPKQEFKPPSFIDRYQHLLDDSEASGLEPIRQEPEPTPPPVENKLGAEIDAMASGGEEDEVALEAYMSNMLRRMRGEESGEDSQPPQSGGSQTNPNPKSVNTTADARDQVATDVAVAEAPLDNKPLDMEQLKQSSRKPALPTDLAAMRELANSSARRAIAKHHQRRHLEKALGLFLVCIISACVGTYMLMTAISAQDFLGLNGMGGAVAVLVGVVGGFKLLGLLLLAIREGAWEKKGPTKAAAAQSSIANEDATEISARDS